MLAWFIREPYANVVEDYHHHRLPSYLQSYVSFKLTLEKALNTEC